MLIIFVSEENMTNLAYLIPKIVKNIIQENKKQLNKKCQHCSSNCSNLVKFICLGGNSNMIADWIKKHPAEIMFMESEHAAQEDTNVWSIADEDLPDIF